LYFVQAGLFLSCATAHAEERKSRRPLPEALLTESATDIDAVEAGELELELNAARAAARRGGAGATLTSLEVEWRVLKEFGLRIEPSYSLVRDAGATAANGDFGLSGALAFGLWHDPVRELHVQAELLGRTPESANARVFEPGEPELPFAADLLAAVRRGRWTLRATVGAEAGGAFAHAPLHTDLALLTGILPEERFGFLVIDLRADWAREAPFVFAPEIVADTSPLDLPFRLGVALPFNFGADLTQTSYGVFVRFAWITNRD
jgi:hypothetical protein